MSRTKWVTSLAFVLMALAAACSPSTSDKAHVVRQFYDHLNKGDYPAAVALYSAEVQEALGPEGANGEGFKEWAKEETLQGKVNDVKIVSENEADGATTVVFELIYADGSSTKRSVSLTEEDGSWRLGFIQNG